MKKCISSLTVLALCLCLFSPVLASAARDNYSSLVIHDAEQGDYTLGSRSDDISLLILGRITCGRTAVVRETVEQIVVGQYTHGVQVYLLDIDQPFDRVLHMARTHAICTVYAWDKDDRYNQLLWDARKAARSFNPSTSDPELLPEVLVLDRNCDVIYAFDESVSDYKEKIERILTPYCSQLSSEEFVIENGVLLKYNGHDSAPAIPSNVTTIGPHAFSENSNISSIAIPNGVTTICDFAFADCYKLSYVAIPKGVIEIGAYAFSDCSRVENVEIPNSVTAIGEGAFLLCRELTQITIPDSVVAIGDSAFYGCQNLLTVILPKDITRIGSSTFSGCSSLTAISIPDSVQYIDMFAFSQCSELTEITIPSNVKVIEMFAFTGCDNLKKVVILSTISELEIDNSAFAYYDSDKGDYIYNSDKDSYMPLPKLTIYSAPNGPVETFAKRFDIPFIANDLWDDATGLCSFGLSGTADYDAANEVLELLNELRKKLGLQPLTMSEPLMDAAMQRAAEIMIYYDHTRPSRHEFRTALPTASVLGENIAVGYFLATDVMEGWSNSPDHYRNMVDSNFRSVGIGCFYQKSGEKYWVQVFSSSNAGNQATHRGKADETREIHAVPNLLKLKASPSCFTLGTGEHATLTLWNLNKEWKDASAVSIMPKYMPNDSNDKNSPIEISPSGVVYARVPGYAAFRFGISPDVSASIKITVDRQINPEVCADFQDVQETDYFYPGVSWAVAHSITNGTSSVTFSPDTICTEEQILTFLWRVKGQPEPRNTYTFANADESDYYYKALCWAKETGIIEDPIWVGTPCTRTSTVKYMWRYANRPEVERLNRFSDVSAWDDDSMAIEWAVDNGITTGTSASTFSPDAICTRAQVVTFLYRGRNT